MKNLKRKNAGLEKRLHFIGIGGIGMSGLAQMFAAEGAIVSGSDRGIHQPENKRIFDSLRKQGIELYEQDGSYMNGPRPDALVYSTAIEEDNPDFLAGAEIARIHRSKAIAIAMEQSDSCVLTAVTGSCGKTTVSAWLAETMTRLGNAPSFLTGGLVNNFAKGKWAGNYYQGTDGHMILEADESDKSLTAYSPDYALILNVGTDHYPKDELLAVFKEFLKKVKKGVVIEQNVYELLGKEAVKGLEVKLFSADIGKASLHSNWRLTDYTTGAEGAKAEINGKYRLNLPAPGIHVAANALAVFASLDMLGINLKNAAEAISQFKGVWRRFDYAGMTLSGAKIYDDYAHNVEKIASCISAAKEISSGKTVTIFQPHGYGPLGFMRNELFNALENVLSDSDVFAMLPVFYAGGSSSFKPSSEEVVADYCKASGKNYEYFASRDAASDFIKKNVNSGDTVLILGARDNSLSDWSQKIANKAC